MGVSMESSSWRSSPVVEYQAIPRYGPASPFKGHLSTKSNAFCIDSSSHRLSNQYLIRDHMAVHYNKILSAKAAVDCSEPKSRLNSVKLADQQRREKLKKEIEKCEKEMSSSKNVSRSNSRERRQPQSATYRKHQVSLEAESNMGLSSCAPNEQKYVSGSLSTPERQITDFREKYTRKAAQKATNSSVSHSSISTPSSYRVQSRVSCSSSSDGVINCYPRKAPKAGSKVQAGDLLEKHSKHFTNGRQPFTPRTLKSDAKSFLSQYRYYTPAKWKTKGIPIQHAEAETQTDISSFQLEPEEFVGRDVADFQKTIKEVSVSAMADKSGEMKVPSPFSSPRVTSPCSRQSPTMRRIQAEEEELLYLNFIQDMTDEILRLGLFSDRALELLFERHIEQNKNHLNETKMRHLLEILKEDLGCNRKKKEVFGSFGLAQKEPADHLQLPQKPQRQKNKDFLKAMDLTASEAALSSPEFSSTIEKVQGKDEFSNHLNNLLNAGLDLPCTALEESPATSCTLPPTLSATTCDADFETSESLQDLDDLHEDMVESLCLTPDNTE